VDHTSFPPIRPVVARGAHIDDSDCLRVHTAALRS
jgi:hypothetical protein